MRLHWGQKVKRQSQAVAGMGMQVDMTPTLGFKNRTPGIFSNNFYKY